MEQDGDIFGEGVNIAARLEGIAEPGGICVSARVQEDAVGKVDLTFEDMGEQALKNIARPVHAFRLQVEQPARAGGEHAARVARQAVDRRPALPEHERRPGTGIFR